MSILALSLDPHAVDVLVDDSALHFILADGREISAPLEWFPRLRDATEVQRKKWRLIAVRMSVCIGLTLTRISPSVR